MNEIQRLYCGHHKCASQWIISVIQPICRDLGWKLARFHNPRMFDCNLDKYLSEHPADFVAYTNADYAYTKDFQKEYRAFHVIRDPRDIIVSSYFSSRNSHPTRPWPELIPHREKLKQVSKDEGILLEMEFIRHFMEHLSTWNYAQPNVLELRYEEVTSAPYQSFLDIFQFLGCLDDGNASVRKRLSYALAALARRTFGVPGKGSHVPAEILLGRVYENQFDRKSGGRSRGTEDVQSHYRKGRAGDWVNHFSDEHRSFFKEKFGDLAVRLGYEQDNNW